ncbi:unnamed protein product [Citrullus colocynthis]|uniref:Uncharacterized protein n=1 Tax=Citrullus colocynthis TaxID=252529 RepID=A0ABP0XXA7_9ROSI
MKLYVTDLKTRYFFGLLHRCTDAYMASNVLGVEKDECQCVDVALTVAVAAGKHSSLLSLKAKSLISVRKSERKKEKGVGKKDGTKRRRIEEDDGVGIKPKEKPSFEQHEHGYCCHSPPRNRLHGLCQQIQKCSQ